MDLGGTVAWVTVLFFEVGRHMAHLGAGLEVGCFWWVGGGFGSAKSV